MHVQGFQDVECEQDAIQIKRWINDRGDHLIEVKLSVEVVNVIKKAKSDKEGQRISIDDSVFQTMLGNLIDYYLGSKTNFIKLAESVSVIHRIVAEVCDSKLNQGVDCLDNIVRENK